METIKFVLDRANKSAISNLLGPIRMNNLASGNLITGEAIVVCLVSCMLFRSAHGTIRYQNVAEQL